MSPASNIHGGAQFRIGKLIEKYREDGEAITECSIETIDGVKVADVCWRSDDFLKKYGYVTPYKIAPEICVEVISPSNAKDEIEEKVSLYFSKGAKEVWICDEDGNMEFYKIEGKVKESEIVPQFPDKVRIRKFEI
jgi:Uma2 family endonuclease